MTTQPPLTIMETLEHIAICPDGCGVCRTMAKDALTAATEVGGQQTAKPSKEEMWWCSNIAIPATIERCAQVAKKYGDKLPWGTPENTTAQEIFAAIKALKEKP